MKRTLLLALLVALWAWPALAVDTTRYPQVLVDSTCTDSYDSPAAQSGGSVRPAVQTSGSADNFCDHDSRIREAAITVDTTWGPFFKKPGQTGILVFADADVVSNDTDTWTLLTKSYRPHEAVAFTLVGTSNQATEGNKLFAFGPPMFDHDSLVVPATSFTHRVAILTSPFYITLNLVTATSWDGNISWMAY